VIHVFVLVVLIGGQPGSDDCREAMCFRDLDECNRFATKLKRGLSPSTQIVRAYCKPILVNPTDEGVKIY
jgi:hypothetical protein